MSGVICIREGKKQQKQKDTLQAFNAIDYVASYKTSDRWSFIDMLKPYNNSA